MAEASHRLIKKYSNRKLYDTQTRRYITLDDIAQLVRGGGEITVVNRDTGEDLTPAILSQIVAREERRGINGDGEGIQERGQALLEYLRRTINVPAELVTGEVERRGGDIQTPVGGAPEIASKRHGPWVVMPSMPTPSGACRYTLPVMTRRPATVMASAPAIRSSFTASSTSVAVSGASTVTTTPGPCAGAIPLTIRSRLVSAWRSAAAAGLPPLRRASRRRCRSPASPVRA